MSSVNIYLLFHFPEEKNNAKLEKRKGMCRITITKIRYERQLESVKQIDNKMTNLIKNNFDENITIIL